jgi:rRNA maturation endonuclease Nob1
MICTCEKCRYTFSTDTQPEHCPDCGAASARNATPSEEKEYHENMKLYGDEKETSQIS